MTRSWRRTSRCHATAIDARNGSSIGRGSAPATARTNVSTPRLDTVSTRTGFTLGNESVRKLRGGGASLRYVMLGRRNYCIDKIIARCSGVGSAAGENQPRKHSNRSQVGRCSNLLKLTSKGVFSVRPQDVDGVKT